MILYDLGLLEYCRDPDCSRAEVHDAHGPAARVVTVPRPVLQGFCYDCGTPWDDDQIACGYCRARTVVDRVVPQPVPPPALGVRRDLVEVTITHVGTYVPTPFSELHGAVVDDFGSVSGRDVQRALRVLVNERRVASIGSSLLPTRVQCAANFKPPGWYIRYDSPKLWRRGGLRDLMSVAAERMMDTVELRSGRRAS